REERKRKNLVRGALIFITLAASIPLMNRYVLTGNDLISHLFRIEGIAEGLCSGQFPVRIMPQWWNEYGYGDPMFYGNAFLYFPAVMLLMNYKIGTAYKCYIAFVNLLTVWISYKSFVKIGKDEKIALVGSAIYSLNIFRLMSLYYNNGVGVYTAMAFLPFVIAGLYCIKEKKGWLYLASGLTGCIQSHLMTCEMIGIFIILFMLIGIREVCQKTVFFNLCKAGVTALLWNLWFIVPFLNIYPGQYKLKEMGDFQSDIQQYGRGFGDWMHNVIASFHGETDILWLGVFIGFTLVCGLVFVFITVIVNWKRSSREIRKIEINAALLGGAALTAMFLSTKYFPYDFLCAKSKILAVLIHSLQFPWRFFEIAAVFAAGAVILGFVIWKKQGYKKICMIIAGILGGICFLETAFYYQRLLIESPHKAELCEYYAFSEYTRTIEYLPASAEVYYEKHQLITSGNEIEIADYKKEYTTIQASIINHSEQEGYLDVPLFFYPCYKAKDVETGEALALTYGENAKIRILLPAGYQGKIKLRVSERKLWKLADMVSILSILTVFYIIITKKSVMDVVSLLYKSGSIKNRQEE
ncbi:MAG: YfhO family protein, partial [Butyrivibrio sp.]|nr:YfhO family protein [Butyrivibrio sp.]